MRKFILVAILIAGIFVEIPVLAQGQTAQRTIKRFSLGGYWTGAACDCASFKDFGPGPGNTSATDDRHWRIRLYLDEPREIEKISLVMHDGSQAWSTHQDLISELSPDPLVVFFNGQKINDRYDQPIGDLGTGELIIDLFGQMDTKSFHGGQLTITFTDGKTMTTGISNVPNNNVDIKCPVGCAAPVIEYSTPQGSDGFVE